MTIRLFICDDDPVIGTLLGLDLSAAGFDVAPQAYTVAEAIEALGRTRPDLMLLDLHMPSVGGLDLLEHMAQTGLHPDLPVVMLTGENDGYYIARAKALGARGYLNKPIETGTLAARIERVLADRSLRWIDDICALTEPGTAAMSHVDLDGDASFDKTAARRLVMTTPVPTLTPTVANLARQYGVTAIEGLLRSLVKQLNLIDLAGEAELEATAHAIRGAAASLGFTEAAKACHELEDAIKGNRPIEAAQTHARLTCRAARKWIDQALDGAAA